MYLILFLARFYPFWAVPMALLFFEMGMQQFNRRKRLSVVINFVIAGLLVITSIVWIIFEGYWRAGPFILKMIEMRPF